MTTVLVHGVPETPAIWDPLAAQLPGDVERLQLPGFGTPLPDGFEPTMNRYAAWLHDELQQRSDVDLVAHDWGAILALRVLQDRPDGVRSWAVDMGDLDADFTWHDLAQVWQTEGAGEEFMDGMLAVSDEERAQLLIASGVPQPGALDMASRIDRTMADAILTLYRSAVDIGTEWGPGIDRITGPGLVLEADNDPFRAAGRTARLAERTGATLATLPGCGHWWMLDDPATAAARLTDWWSQQ